MQKYIITTDTACDLPSVYLKEHNVPTVPLFYVINGQSYGGENEMVPEEFYASMRDGIMPTTNAVNPEDFKDMVRPFLEEGYDILHLAFSSGLSSTCQNAILAANDILEDYPDRKILVFDTLAASLGQGLVVYKAVQKKENGMGMEELYQWLMDNREHFCHRFTVNDLFHLYRGGRVTKATAIVGSLANIKPILNVNEEGKLINIAKAMGRKKSLTTLVDMMGDLIKGVNNDTIFISHGDCEEDAEYVAELVHTRYGIPCKIINIISPTIGAHAGPGTVALFFMGNKR